MRRKIKLVGTLGYVIFGGFVVGYALTASSSSPPVYIIDKLSPGALLPSRYRGSHLEVSSVVLTNMIVSSSTDVAFWMNDVACKGNVKLADNNGYFSTNRTYSLSADVDYLQIAGSDIKSKYHSIFLHNCTFTDLDQ